MTERLPEHIEQDYVARRVQPEAAVELDGDEVLYVPDPPRLFTLNPTARVVWHSLDGVVSVGGLAEELSDEFGVERERMLSDVLGLVRELGRSGLLVGVTADPSTLDSQRLRRHTANEPADARPPGGEGDSVPNR